MFADLPRGRLLVINLDTRDSSRLADKTEITLIPGGREQDPVGVAGFPNTCGPGNRVDLRPGTDSTGALYLPTKGDGWARKPVPASAR